MLLPCVTTTSEQLGHPLFNYNTGCLLLIRWCKVNAGGDRGGQKGPLQQKEMLGSAPGTEQILRLGARWLGSSLAERALGVLVAASSVPWQLGGKLLFGVHYTQHSQPVKRDDSPVAFSVGEASP